MVLAEQKSVTLIIKLKPLQKLAKPKDFVLGVFPGKHSTAEAILLGYE